MGTLPIQVSTKSFLTVIPATSAKSRLSFCKLGLHCQLSSQGNSDASGKKKKQQMLSLVAAFQHLANVCVCFYYLHTDVSECGAFPGD